MSTRKNAKAISDEEIIAAILQAGTIKEAAAALEMPSRTIYDRMQERSFRAAYQEAKNDILRQAVKNLNSKLSAAVDAVAEIMTNSEVNAAVRLQAAQTIISNAVKFAGLVSSGESTALDTANPWAFAEE